MRKALGGLRSGIAGYSRFLIRLGVPSMLLLLATAPTFAESAASPTAALTRSHVGTNACAGCHPEILSAYEKGSKKAHSFFRIGRIRGLTDSERNACFECHTNGYGQPGGFVSASATPDLANPGCESCHGPGSAHVEGGGDKTLIVRNPPLAGCLRCHDDKRVERVNFKGLIWRGH